METRYQFQQLPWRIHLSKWGQLGKAATKPRWPEGANEAGARMGKKAEKEAPCSARSPSKPPCCTPAAAFLPLTAPCRQERVVQALPHTATASLPDLLLRATGEPLMLCTQWEGIHRRAALPAPVCPVLLLALDIHGLAPSMVWHPSSNANTVLHGASRQAASHCHPWPTPLLHQQQQLLRLSVPHHLCLDTEPRLFLPNFTCLLH